MTLVEAFYEECRQNDIKWLDTLKDWILYFNRMYLKEFGNEKTRESLTNILNGLHEEKEQLDAKLNRGNRTPKNVIRWYVEENTPA